MQRATLAPITNDFILTLIDLYMDDMNKYDQELADLQETMASLPPYAPASQEHMEVFDNISERIETALDNGIDLRIL
jgi:uncharacterized protein YkwD